MGFGEKIGESYVRKQLKKKVRKPKTIGYGHAQSIGLVYQIKDKDYQHFINKFVGYLGGEIGFKNIQTIGFFQGREVPEFVKSGNKYQTLTKKDIKWNKIPKKDAVRDFVSHDYDILIDLTDKFIIPLKSVFVEANAKLKIGLHEEENQDFYDFMIALPKNATIQDYINQINHYLNLIDKD